jgi:hypothetical protein
MKKAGVMGQARKEPRFADLEVLAPMKPGGAAARLAMIDADVSDADFEIVGPSNTRGQAPKTSRDPQYGSVPGLGLLRQNAAQHASSLASGDQLSPGFLAITLMLALAVFWLCGGHALLY